MFFRLVVLITVLGYGVAFSQIVVTNNPPNDTEEYLVNNILCDDDLTTSNFSSVGFEFYSKVLSSFLSSKEEERDCFVDCFNGFLPFSYVPDSGVRSHYYSSIFSCSSFWAAVSAFWLRV